ncbi:MAG: DUF5048 domain-containing protein [Lachnospiraceae bacterium]|nr:DUF5048 domain-containing protein [Lachnospiraceae bacterium]
MKYPITETDKNLLLQSSMDYKYRLLILNDAGNILDSLTGVSQIGSYSVDSQSDIRRTCSFVLLLDNCYRTASVEKKLFSWIGCHFKLQIGIYSLKEDEYHWYDCGYYLITEANTSYNVTDNSLSVDLSDWYSRLNGLRNGQIGGAPTIRIPNLDDDGNPVTLKQVVENLLRAETPLTDFIVDDIGEAMGMPQNNTSYEDYRAGNPLWNQLPYDLEFTAGCTIEEILSEVRELYPNCQMYFDIYGNFCFNQIPSCEHDPLTLSNSYLQQILLAEETENSTYNLEDIKNITEVFGTTYDIDRFASACTLTDNIYTLSLDDYGTYATGDFIAFTPDTTNALETKIRINALDALPLYRDNTNDYIDTALLESGKTYVFQIRYKDSAYVAYYLGQYQPHSLCVLTDNAEDSYYTKAYFAARYNCSENNITLRVEPDSPFTVQKIGEVLDVKTGDTFDNILSDSVAMENAVYYNKQSSSVHDTVTISTKMIPFLDINTKIEYRKQQETQVHSYIISRIENNTDSATSKITMYRFYPLYHA